MILPNEPGYSKSTIAHITSCNWLNYLSFGVTDTDKKKGYIYVDVKEQADVVAYKEQFCKIWLDNYLSRMESYEGPEMVEIPPELSGNESNIVPFLKNEIKFNANEDQQYCFLEKDEQILKPKSCGRGLMISDFV